MPPGEWLDSRSARESNTGRERKKAVLSDHTLEEVTSRVTTFFEEILMQRGPVPGYGRKKGATGIRREVILLLGL